MRQRVYSRRYSSARGVGLIVDELVFATEDDAALHRIAIRRPDLAQPTALERRAIAARLDQLVRSRQSKPNPAALRQGVFGTARSRSLAEQNACPAPFQ